MRHTDEAAGECNRAGRPDQGSTDGTAPRIFEILGMDIRKQVGDYLSQLMDVERIRVLGREKYERTAEPSDHGTAATREPSA